MKLLNFLPLAPAVAAFVVPNQQVFQDIASESTGLIDHVTSSLEELVHELKGNAAAVKDKAENILDETLKFSSDAVNSLADEAFDARSWVQANVAHLYGAEEQGFLVEDIGWPAEDRHDDDDHHHDKPPHDKPPHHGPPHHRPPRRRPGHNLTNQTIYQVIAESKYTTKLAKLLEDFPDLIKTLNGTAANYTIFAPIDSAFDKIPEHAPKPSKEQLEKLLTYHVSPDFYPAFRVLNTHTIPTLFETDELVDKPVPARVSVNIGLRGLTINFISRVVGVNFFTSNGVIHAVDSFILPPPKAVKIIDLLPSEFSTLELALIKTGLAEEWDGDHKGGTLFAPNNFAFAKLGPKINGFLFSKYGQKYLKALLKYHVVPGTVLYSDAIYTDKSDDDEKDGSNAGPRRGVPKGLYHYNLPTLLEDRSLSVDVARYGGFISIKVNGFTNIVVQDGIARDGVIHVPENVLIPPKSLPGSNMEESLPFEAEMGVEELKARLEPYLE